MKSVKKFLKENQVWKCILGHIQVKKQSCMGTYFCISKLMLLLNLLQLLSIQSKSIRMLPDLFFVYVGSFWILPSEYVYLEMLRILSVGLWYVSTPRPRNQFRGTEILYFNSLSEWGFETHLEGFMSSEKVFISYEYRSLRSWMFCFSWAVLIWLFILSPWKTELWPALKQ